MYLRTAIVLAALAFAGNAAELSVGHGVIYAGAGQPPAMSQPVTVDVTLASLGADLTGIQFDLEYDAASLNVAIAAGPVAGKAGKSVQSAVLQAGKQRVLIVGINRNTIGDGVVATLQVSLKGEPEPGKTFPIRLTTVSGTNAKAEAVAVTAANGSVKVEVRRNAK